MIHFIEQEQNLTLLTAGFLSSLVKSFADISAEFSFAYLEEAGVPTLVSLGGTYLEAQFDKSWLEQTEKLRKHVNEDFKYIAIQTQSDKNTVYVAAWGLAAKCMHIVSIPT
jgi:hypothetical protein